MSDQFNLYADSSDVRDVICERLKAVYIDTPDYPMFSLNKMENSVTATLNHYDETLEESCCVFPHRNGNNTFRFEDLVYGTGIVKSGCHDPMGVLMIYGPGISAGVTMNDCTTLDIAPTLMTVLGLPVPSFMKGRVLSEAFA
jgi:bisphosphoglycerate-independent phosphoglycerate mutase (AlkP superfamily)